MIQKLPDRIIHFCRRTDPCVSAEIVQTTEQIIFLPIVFCDPLIHIHRAPVIRKIQKMDVIKVLQYRGFIAEIDTDLATIHTE